MRLASLLSAAVLVPPLTHAQIPAASSVHVASGYVAVTHGRLYYESAGAGPVVVFLNGANLGARMWDAQFTALAGTHRVIRYDERGFGRSSPADVPYAAVQDLWMLLEALM
jgi:pimeloyl-ACP methyl ester carboxylesterase